MAKNIILILSIIVSLNYANTAESQDSILDLRLIRIIEMRRDKSGDIDFYGLVKNIKSEKIFSVRENSFIPGQPKYYIVDIGIDGLIVCVSKSVISDVEAVESRHGQIVNWKRDLMPEVTYTDCKLPGL